MKFNNGSALLIVLLVLQIILLITFGWWKNSSLYYDIVQEREDHQRFFYITDFIFLKMSFLAKKILQRGVMQEEVFLDLGFMSKILEIKDLEGLRVRATFLLINNQEALHLKTFLYKAEKEVCSIEGIIERKKCNNEKTRFFIKYYTVCFGI